MPALWGIKLFASYLSISSENKSFLFVLLIDLINYLRQENIFCVGHDVRKTIPEKGLADEISAASYFRGQFWESRVSLMGEMVEFRHLLIGSTHVTLPMAHEDLKYLPTTCVKCFSENRACSFHCRERLASCGVYLFLFSCMALAIVMTLKGFKLI